MSLLRVSTTPSLSSLSSDILENHILSRLSATSLTSCSLTCRHLYTTISSSMRLTYQKELAIAGMADNPLCSYQSIPINLRLKQLREHVKRTASATPQWVRKYEIGHGYWGWTLGDQSGILLREKYTIRGLYPSSRALSFSKLPSEPDAQLEWSEQIQVPEHEDNILVYGLALEHDLLACILCPIDEPSWEVGHLCLLQFSTLRAHPLAASPVITIHNTFTLDYKTDSILVCGSNLAVAPCSGYDKDLAVWNWKTGKKKAYFPFHFNMNQSSSEFIAFLREDLLMVANHEVFSLDVYYIPPEEDGELVATDDNDTSFKDHINIPLIQRYLLPKLKGSVICTSMGLFSSLCRSENDFPDATKPFVHDSVNNIFGIDIQLRRQRPAKEETENQGVSDLGNDSDGSEFDMHSDDATTSFFTIITHVDTVLSQVVGRLDPSTLPSSPLPAVAPEDEDVQSRPSFPQTHVINWADWGPPNTRIFVGISFKHADLLGGLDHIPRNLQNASGSRRVVVSPVGQEESFGEWKGFRIHLEEFARLAVAKAASAVGLDENKDQNSRMQIIDSSHPAIIPASDESPFVAEVRSSLGYLSSVWSFENGNNEDLSVRIIDKVLVDNDRVVLIDKWDRWRRNVWQLYLG